MNAKQYGLTVMLVALSQLALAMDGEPWVTSVMIDQLEHRQSGSEESRVLEGEAWIGKELDKFWLSAEVEDGPHGTEEAEIQALFSRGIASYWDLQAGLRHDFEPGPGRSWGVVGLKGLAPYFFEVDAALFVGEAGRTALRLEAEYDLLLTQRLILSPELEVNVYGKDDADMGVGSGLSEMEAGLRLRYEIRREFAPYIGVSRSRLFGDSADFARADGERSATTQWLVGLRTWF